MTDRILYDKTSAAEMLSTSTRRIDELRRSRLLVGLKDGREYKYTQDELQRYVNSLKTSIELDR